MKTKVKKTKAPSKFAKVMNEVQLRTQLRVLLEQYGVVLVQTQLKLVLAEIHDEVFGE
jgi:hypothetical protein